MQSETNIEYICNKIKEGISQDKDFVTCTFVGMNKVEFIQVSEYLKEHGYKYTTSCGDFIFDWFDFTISLVD